MKKTSNRISLIVLSLCIFILVCVGIWAVIGTDFNNVAVAANIGIEGLGPREVSELYTDSDQIYGMQQTIREYPASLYRSQARVNRNKLEISGDDPIVNIIPREYFRLKGEHFYLGKEYGFFVNTQNQVFNSGNRISEVLVFDVVTNNDFDKTTSKLIVRVEPIFQYCYAYVTGNEDYVVFQETNLSIDYNIASDKNYIVPLPNKNYVFEPYSKYYLKDICFGATLFNEQELNTIDAQYEPEQDDGSFIIRDDYMFKGVVRDEERSMQSTEDLGNSINNSLFSTISFGLGFAGALTPPPINMVCGALSLVFALVPTFHSYSDIVDSVNNLTPAETTVSSGRMRAECKYTTRRDQLAHYVDSETRKPALTKAATIIVQGDDNNFNLWYNVGSYAEGYFTLADSAPKNPWYTRYIQEIVLSVVDVNGNEHVHQGHSSNTYWVHEPIYKEIGIEDNQTLSLLPEGNNYFMFEPQFDSEYILSFDKPYDFQVYVQDIETGVTEEVMPTEDTTPKDYDRYKYVFKGRKKYNIQIFSYLGDVVHLNIVPNDSSISAKILKDSRYIFKYESTDEGMMTVRSTNWDAPIYDVYTKRTGKGGLAPIAGFSNLKQSASLEMYMQANQTYYIVLRNKTTSTASAYVRVSNLNRNLVEGDNNSLQLQANGNYIYYKFLPTTTGDYHITFDNNVSEDYLISFNCFDKDLNKLTTSEYNDGYLILRNLQANTEYYIGIASTLAMIVTPKVARTEPIFEWRYLVNNAWKTITNEELFLTRGREYEFGLWINGIQAQNYDILIGSVDDSSFIKCTDSRCRIQIAENALDYSHIEIQAKFEGKNGLNYDNGIRIYAVFDNAQVYVSSVDYNNDTIINLNSITDIIKWNATLSGKNNAGKSFTYSYSNLTDLTHSVYNALFSNQALGQVVFKITDVLIKSANNGGERLISLNYQTNIGATYSTSEIVNGKTAYHIGNALQFNNIRYSQTNSRIFDNDISLSRYPLWNPITTLNCNINGNGHKLTDLKVQVEGNAYAYDRYGLIGTNNAEISNLTLANYTMSFGYEEKPNWTYVGPFAGVNNGTIKFCYAYGSIKGYRDFQSVGGIVGLNSGNILNSECGKAVGMGIATSIVYSWGDVGGICGQNYGTIMDSRTLNTKVQQRLYGSSRNAGGIVGYGDVNNSIIRCSVEDSAVENVNDVTIKSLYPKMGVIVGHMIQGTITSVGARNVSTSTGTLYKNNVAHCFNGPWPFYGLMENCTVDGHTGQYGP